MSKSLEARIVRLEQATIGARSLLCLWGPRTPAKMRAEVKAAAAAEGLPEDCIDVLCVPWLEGRAVA